MQILGRLTQNVHDCFEYIQRLQFLHPLQLSVSFLDRDLKPLSLYCVQAGSDILREECKPLILRTPLSLNEMLADFHLKHFCEFFVISHSIFDEFSIFMKFWKTIDRINIFQKNVLKISLKKQIWFCGLVLGAPRSLV